nr:MAG TPA: hypothetical protein [Caudoviricetes sp.]
MIISTDSLFIVFKLLSYNYIKKFFTAVYGLFSLRHFPNS